MSKANERMLKSLRGMKTWTVGTPPRRLKSDRLELYAKVEWGGISGSIKDRAALNILEQALVRGDVTPDTVVVESTSGNLGMALGRMCQAIGVRFIAVIDPLINPATEAKLRDICFEVIKVTERDGSGGYLLNRRRVVSAQKDRFPSVYVPNQYENPDNYLAYYSTLGVELCRDLPDLDYLFIAVSSGGTITGVSKRFRESSPNTRIVAVDVEGSVIFGGAPRKRNLSGIGSSLVPELLSRASIDHVMATTELEIVEGCRQLLTTQLVFAGASSGACYAAIMKHFASQRVSEQKPKVAFICPDLGDAYVDTVYNQDWVDSVLLNGNVETVSHALSQ